MRVINTRVSLTAFEKRHDVTHAITREGNFNVESRGELCGKI